MGVKDQIVSEIELLAKSKVGSDDEIIFGKGRLLDSLNVLHILLFIELNYGLKIDTKELSIDNFNTVSKIVSYVEKRV